MGGLVGAGAGAEVVFGVILGTGVGGALFLDGKPYRGRSGLAGEIGNMSIDWNGERCWCGSRACCSTPAS